MSGLPADHRAPWGQSGTLLVLAPGPAGGSDWGVEGGEGVG